MKKQRVEKAKLEAKYILRETFKNLETGEVKEVVNEYIKPEYERDEVYNSYDENLRTEAERCMEVLGLPVVQSWEAKEGVKGCTYNTQIEMHYTDPDNLEEGILYPMGGEYEDASYSRLKELEILARLGYCISDLWCEVSVSY